MVTQLEKPTPVTVSVRFPNRLLTWVGLGYLLLALLFAVLSQFDARQVLGLNVWIKPLKFALSIAIYAFTIDWLLQLSDTKPRLKQTIAWLTTVAMVIEMGIIAGQSARGQASHFNESSLLNGILFSIMGLFITANTVLVGYLLFRFFRQRTLAGYPLSLLWSIRWGVTIFVLGCLEGSLIVMNRAHTVGAADGGAGLPLLNWSTSAGDLRIAHFMGLHALQVLPLLTWALIRVNRAPSVRQVGWMAVVYLLLNISLLIVALLGRSMF